MRLCSSELFVSLGIAAEGQNLGISIGGLNGKRPSVCTVKSTTWLAGDFEDIEGEILRGNIPRCLLYARPKPNENWWEVSKTPGFPPVD